MQPSPRSDFLLREEGSGSLDEDRVTQMLQDFGPELFGHLVETFRHRVAEALEQLEFALSRYCEQSRNACEEVSGVEMRDLAARALDAFETRLQTAHQT